MFKLAGVIAWSAHTASGLTLRTRKIGRTGQIHAPPIFLPTKITLSPRVDDILITTTLYPFPRSTFIQSVLWTCHGSFSGVRFSLITFLSCFFLFGELTNALTISRSPNRAKKKFEKREYDLLPFSGIGHPSLPHFFSFPTSPLFVFVTDDHADVHISPESALRSMRDEFIHKLDLPIVPPA